jgi:voltage-gated potassium channel
MAPAGDKKRVIARDDLYRIIFEAETPAGKLFDVVLLWLILASVVAVMLESVDSVKDDYVGLLRAAEWIITVAFTLEYGLRLACAPSPARYARSFFGIVDLLSILPTYLSLILPGAQSLLVIRALRLLRVFRVLKLGHFLGEANVLKTALLSSRHKVIVFLGTVCVLVVIIGSAMYLIEGPERGFTSIPRAMYWAVVTLTTVGYGDITPTTVPGQMLAALVMILGYSIIAVPTGIVTAEIVETARHPTVAARVCRTCFSSGHVQDARFCKDCGTALTPPAPQLPDEP